MQVENMCGEEEALGRQREAPKSRHQRIIWVVVVGLLALLR